MTKVFKVIMNILVILFIAALAALFVPPLLGITTVVAEPDKATNMQVGSVAYGNRIPIDELESGDSIIYNSETETYIYEITKADSKTGTIKARTSSDAKEKSIDLRRTASKLLFTIPFIGYISIALQSSLGMIILLLVAVLLVVLFIISDILYRKAKKRDDDDYDDEYDDEDVDEDTAYFSALAQSKDKPHALDAIQAQDASVSKASVSDETRNISAEKVGTETLEDISYFGEDDEPAPAKPAATVETPASSETSAPEKTIKIDLDSPEETKADKEEFPFVSEKPAFDAFAASSSVSTNTDNIPDMKAALEAALNSAQVNRSTNVTPVVQQPVVEEDDFSMPDEIELAIPVRTLENLLSEAYAKGEDPRVTKDEASGVTFVDYSDYLK